MRVQIEVPYDEEGVNVIRPYRSNTTTFELGEGVWSGDYATLAITGNQASEETNSTGATVAEWAIVAAGEGVGDS